MVITYDRTYFSTRLFEITTQPTHSSDIDTKYKFSGILLRLELDLARKVLAVLLRSKIRCAQNRSKQVRILILCIYRTGMQVVSSAVLGLFTRVNIGDHFLRTLQWHRRRDVLMPSLPVLLRDDV